MSKQKENLENDIKDWRKNLSYNSQYGTISVVDLTEGETGKGRTRSRYQIMFNTPDKVTINFNTRRGVASILKQLLENFGEYTTLNKYGKEDEVYESYESIKFQIVPLRSLLKDTPYSIEKNMNAKDIQYKICFKADSQISDKSLQEQ